MHAYVVLLILSSIVCAMMAGALSAFRFPRRDAHVAIAMLGCGTLWSLLQAMWCSAEDPETAILLVRLSSLGWMPIAPLILHLVMNATPEPRPALRRLIPGMYYATGLLILLDCFTPWVHPRAVPTSWGYSYEVGLGFIFSYGSVALLAFPAIVLAIHDFRSSPSPAERNQSSVIGIALLIPLIVASITDGLCPALGIPVPHMGGISVSFLGVVTAWSSWRYGYSVLIPSVFGREILETLPDGVVLLHLDGRIRMVNQSMGMMAGQDARELEDRHIAELLSSPSDAILRGSRALEGELRSHGGESIPVLLSSNPLRDKAGLQIGVVLVVHDQREVAELRNRLLLSGRLASVGELAAGVAHEINNPLAYVRSNLALLTRHWKEVRSELLLRLPDPPAGEERRHFGELLDEGDDLFTESLEGVDRAVAIVRDIKGFSHVGSGEHETVDLHQLLDSVIRVATPQLGGDVSLDTDYGDLPLICCAPQELKQVVLNLVINASQAVGSAGRIQIQTRCEDGEAVIRVRDDGCGIPPELLGRIFDPFFTTKGVGEGTGLGLAISYEILRRHEGAISVQSRPGQGTCFEVRFPIRPGAGEPT